MQEQRTESTEAEGPKKVPLILLSGGLDSTYCLLHLLKESDVDVVYIAASQGPHKINAELQAIEDILEMVRTISPISPEHKVRNIYHVRTESETWKNVFQVDTHTGQKFKQPQLWIQGVLMVARPDLHSQVVISYVTGDQMLSHIADLEYAWNYTCSFVFGEYRAIPIHFPLRYSKKRQLINELPIGLLSKTWTCELPKWNDGSESALGFGVGHSEVSSLSKMKSDRRYRYKPCGKCDACLAQKESFVTTKYGDYLNMKMPAMAADNPGEFISAADVEK